jgi:phage terminase large subunit GpA-like protein
MRNKHAITLEHLRMGALKGVILDADGSMLLNLYEAFEITPKVVSFALATATTDVKKKCLDVKRYIEDSPSLRDKVKDPRSRDSGNTVQSKEFPGGVIVVTGANSAVGLRSIPVRYLFLDEIDAYPGDVDGEGDPVSLAI